MSVHLHSASGRVGTQEKGDGWPYRFADLMGRASPANILGLTVRELCKLVDVFDRLSMLRDGNSLRAAVPSLTSQGRLALTQRPLFLDLIGHSFMRVHQRPAGDFRAVVDGSEKGEWLRRSEATVPCRVQDRRSMDVPMLASEIKSFGRLHFCAAPNAVDCANKVPSAAACPELGISSLR